jgi:hypothetical protein
MHQGPVESFSSAVTKDNAKGFVNSNPSVEIVSDETKLGPIKHTTYRVSNGDYISSLMTDHEKIAVANGL